MKNYLTFSIAFPKSFQIFNLTITINIHKILILFIIFESNYI